MRKDETGDGRTQRLAALFARNKNTQQQQQRHHHMPFCEERKKDWHQPSQTFIDR